MATHPVPLLGLFPRALGLPSGSRILRRPRCPLPPPLPCPLAAPSLRLCSRGRAGSKQLDIYSPHLPLLAQRHFPAALLPSLHTPDAKSAPSEQLSTALLQKRDRETCSQAAPRGWLATTGANKPQNRLHPSLQSLLSGSSSTEEPRDRREDSHPRRDKGGTSSCAPVLPRMAPAPTAPILCWAAAPCLQDHQPLGMRLQACQPQNGPETATHNLAARQG